MNHSPRYRSEINGLLPLFYPPYAGDEQGTAFISVKDGFKIQYRNNNGILFQGDSFSWLDSLENERVDLVFADPPYNIKKAAWDGFESQEEYIIWSLRWIKQAARILKPSGSLYICGFSEILADLKRPACKYFKNCRWLIWHYKNKANLGRDWGVLMKVFCI